MLSVLENEGKDCYSECGDQQGPCSFCGGLGLCCKIGNDNIGNGCDGKLGGQNGHECVRQPGWFWFFKNLLTWTIKIKRKWYYVI